jgi:hypothetical protein
MIPITRPIRKPPRPSESQLIHRIAWNKNFANFAFWAFSEVQRIGSQPAAFFMKMV